MPETDQGASTAQEGGSVEENSPAEGTLFVLEDDQGLDVLEGLAQEDRPQVALAPPLSTPEASAGPTSSSSETGLHDAVAELGADLGRRIDALRSTFERELRAEANRERVIDRLHAELQDYKQDLLLKVQRPIFVDLIQLHDDVGKMAAARSALRRRKRWFGLRTRHSGIDSNRN